MKEIEEKIKELKEALNKTTSVYLKRDYTKAIRKLRKKLDAKKRRNTNQIP